MENINILKKCPTCLSLRRNLLVIGLYSDVLQRLVPSFSHYASEKNNTRTCWECHALLRQAYDFQRQVERANELLNTDIIIKCNTLSSLTSGNNINTEYSSKNNVSQVKQESSDEDMKGYDETVPLEQDLNEKCTFKNVISNEDVKTNTTEVPKVIKNDKNHIKTVNKWATKRLARNKKLKFKAVKGMDFAVDDVFRKLDNTENIYRNECEKCESVFESKEEFKEHVSSEHFMKLMCDVCSTIFSDKNELETHIMTHSKYICVVCKYVCGNRIECRNHLNEKHQRLFICLKCDLKYMCRRDFYKHYKEWHENYICDYCGISFKMKYCIKSHIRKQHSPFECKLCQKSFARYNGLWLHNKVRHSESKTTAYCVECDKNFTDVYRYKWHLANSVRHKPRKKVEIPCPDCNKVFSKKIYMKDHHNLVHLKLHKYRCEGCNKNFIRNADLVKHRRRVHEGIMPPKNKICCMCGRGFTTNKILTNHLRTHTGEKPYACSECPARFAQRNSLSGHQKAMHRPKDTNRT